MLEVSGRIVGRRGTSRLTVSGSTLSSITPVARDSDVWIAPGFVDIQVNGYAGFDVRASDVDEHTIHDLTRALWAQGITAFCPTVTTGPEDRITTSLAAIAAARAADPLTAQSIPCAHVEGPHLSAEDGPRGAHSREHLRPPDTAEFHRWQKAANGIVGIVTIAPELPGAAQYIRTVADTGVVVALGHTAADRVDIARAVAAGARLSTHLGNGAHAYLRRHPNYIWEQLAEDHLVASFIADGHHLPTATFAAMVAAKGYRRSILISDSVAVSGSPAGRYEGPTGTALDLSDDGRVRLTGTPLLAGGTSSQSECVAWSVCNAGLGLTKGIAMASTNPARLLRQLGVRREIRVGGRADLTVFRLNHLAARMEIVATIIDGNVVHLASDADHTIRTR